MRKYSIPVIDILLFAEEEDILTASTAITGTYSAAQLNEYMFNNASVTSTTTIKIQDVKVTSN